jgi:hypothetical protein
MSSCQLDKGFVSVNNLYFLLLLTSETIFWVRYPIVVFPSGSWFPLHHQNSCVHCYIALHILVIVIVARSNFNSTLFTCNTYSTPLLGVFGSLNVFSSCIAHILYIYQTCIFCNSHEIHFGIIVNSFFFLKTRVE